MQLCNKSVAMSLRARGVTSLDNAIMLWQQIAAVSLNFFMCKAFKNSPTWQMKPFTGAQIKRLILPSVLFVVMLLCSLKALKTVHVATVVVARNACTFVVAFAEYLVFGSAISRQTMFALVVMLLGSVIYGFNDLHFDPVGYTWIFWNSLMFSTNQIYEKWAMGKSKDQTALGVSTIKNTLSTFWLVILMAYQKEFFEIVPALENLSQLSPWTSFLIVLTGGGCCALSICYMMLYKLDSSTAITVAGNFSKVLSIIGASVLFHSALGFLQSVGLAVSIGGSFWYTLEKKKEMDLRQKHQKLKEKGA
eukprot:gene1221-741_t